MVRRAPPLLISAVLSLAVVLSSCRDGSNPIAPEFDVRHGVDESRLNALQLDNPVGATLYQTTRVTGDVVLTRGTLDGEQTMIIGGDLVEAVGGNQYRVLNTTFTGSPSLPASIRTNATFTAAHAVSQDLEVVGAHRTTLDGTEEQTVYLYHSGADQARFEDLVVDNAVGATFFGTVRVTDTLTVSTALNVDVRAVALVAGLFTLESGATLTNEGSLQANDCQLLGTVVGNAPVCP